MLPTMQQSPNFLRDYVSLNLRQFWASVFKCYESQIPQGDKGGGNW